MNYLFVFVGVIAVIVFYIWFIPRLVDIISNYFRNH